MRLRSLSLLDGDDAFLVDFAHRLGDQLTDRVVVVGRDRADLLDLVDVAADFLTLLAQILHDDGYGLVDAALQVHRVGAGSHVLNAYAHDSLCQHRSGRRTVSGVVGRLRGHFLDHLGAHVGDRVFQLDLLGYGYTVLGHLRRTELLVDNDVAAFRAEGDLHCVSQRVDAFLEQLAGFGIVFDLFCHDCFRLRMRRSVR